MKKKTNWVKGIIINKVLLWHWNWWYPSLLLPDVAISLDRTEGATLEFYEAEAKKAGEAVFHGCCCRVM
nr:DUF1327 domain-containing protein [Escherichia coli]